MKWIAQIPEDWTGPIAVMGLVYHGEKKPGVRVLTCIAPGKWGDWAWHDTVETLNLAGAEGRAIYHLIELSEPELTLLDGKWAPVSPAFVEEARCFLNDQGWTEVPAFGSSLGFRLRAGYDPRFLRVEFGIGCKGRIAQGRALIHPESRFWSRDIKACAESVLKLAALAKEQTRLARETLEASDE